MDGLFFGRLDLEDKIARIIHKEMEMIWSGSDSLGRSIKYFASAENVFHNFDTISRISLYKKKTLLSMK